MSTARQGAQRMAAAGARSILVVEDNPVYQTLIRRQLTQLDYDVTIASHGAQALACWMELPHALIILDRNLPDMVGEQLACAIRNFEAEHGGHVPIIGLTADNDLEVNSRCLQAGMDEVLCKPADLPRLRKMLLRWMKSQEPADVLDATVMHNAIDQIGDITSGELIGLFVASARADLSVCRTCLEAGDRRTLAALMHRHKSAAGTIGAIEFAQMAERIEWGALNNVDELGALVHALEHALELIESAADALPPPCAAKARGPGASDIPQMALMEAIRNNALAIHFQPQVDAATLRPLAVDALARWERQGAPVAPPRLIAAAERHGLIAPVSGVLMAQAVFGAARLHAQGYRLRLAVNIAPASLLDSAWPDFIDATLNCAGFPADMITFKLAPAPREHRGQLNDRLLQRLCAMGLTLSVNGCDGGEQYVPAELVGEFKFDRQMVRAATCNPHMRTILAARLASARKLNVATLAVGVGSTAELELLRELGCQAVQGRHMAPVMPSAELLAWLKGAGQV